MYDLRRSNIESLYLTMNQFDWSFLTDIDSPDDQWDQFYAIFKQAIADTIPSREVMIYSTDKDWMTPLTKCLINDHWEAYRKKEWNLFNHLKEKVKIEILKAK